jgi:hypothetical protein
MRSKCLLVGLLAVLIAVGPASAQELQWTRQFGASGFDVARAIGADKSHVYAFGAVSGALPGQTYAGGPDDVFFRNYDSSGNEIWTREFGTSGDDFPMSGHVAIDRTGLYVGGSTSDAFPGKTNLGPYDMVLRKYDFAGNVVWTEQFGTSGDDFLDAIAVQQDGLFVVGTVNGVLPGQTGGGSYDAFIRRYDLHGNEVWTRQFGGSGTEDFQGVAADRTGIYVAGVVSTLPNFEGDTDALVAKYDFDGNLAWTRQFGVSTVDSLEGIALSRGVYVAGFTEGTFPGQTSAGGEDVFIRKYDANGNEVWTRQFGTAGNDGASFRDVATDGRGVWITGNVAGTLPSQTSAGGRDAFVRQYSHGGDELLTLQFGTSGDDRAIAIAVGDDDDLYVGGRTSGAFPGFTYSGGTDAFVTKLTIER